MGHEHDNNGTIIAFLRGRFPAFGDHALTAETPLLETGAIDSLGLLDLMSHLGDAFGIAIEDADFTPEHFETVATLARFVAMKQAA